MPTTTVFSRVKTDFLAIFGPGAYVFSIILFAYLTISHKNANISISHRIQSFLVELKENWTLTLIIIIICYLIGILIRSFRVTIADELCEKLFSRFMKGERTKKLYKSSFPYPSMLRELIQPLTRSKVVSNFKLPNEDDLYSLHQFWKISICSELPDVFIYTQNMEATVRLFAGMFWAGLLGIIGSFFILATWIIKSSLVGIAWLKLSLILFFISLTISIIFGMTIRRVRVQEVRYVFSAYLMLQEKRQGKRK